MDANNVQKVREALIRADKALTRISRSAWFIDATFGLTVEVIEARKAIAEVLDPSQLLTEDARNVYSEKAIPTDGNKEGSAK